MTVQYHKLKEETQDSIQKSRRNADDSNKMTHSLQDEIEKLKQTQKELLKDKQRLEQENDSLERRERVANASVQDLTEKLNKMIEDNAWLQTEVDEHTTKDQETMQRMKDEIRELKLELSLTTGKPRTPRSEGDALDSANAISTKTNGGPLPSHSASVDIVNEMIAMVKDVEQRLISNKRSGIVVS